MQIALRGPSPRSVKLEWRYVFWLWCFQRKTRRRDLPGGAGLASCSWLMPRLRPPPSPERRVEAQVRVNNFVYSQEVAPMCACMFQHLNYKRRPPLRTLAHLFVRAETRRLRCEPCVLTAVSQRLELWYARLQLLSLFLKVSECKQGEAESWYCTGRCCAEASL